MSSSSNGASRNNPRRSADGDTYFVGSEEWKVGDRYELIKLLGTGSFSSVCLAVEKETGEKVALKRIADVLSSPEAARKTLREVCILRRLTGHPCIIGLRDAFVRPSTAGPRALSADGSLVAASIDVYIAMEPATDGDLFSLRGQVSAATARSLLGQLCSALAYLHANGVWHRDVKSSNVLLTRGPGGVLVAKLADFGSARSAAAAAATTPASKKGGSGGGRGTQQQLSSFHHSDSFAQALDEAAARPDDLIANPNEDDDDDDDEEEEVEEEAAAAEGAGAADGDDVTEAKKQQQQSRRNSSSGSSSKAKASKAQPTTTPRSGWRAPLTRLVATPLYRAPEVILGRVGCYSAAIDMWSLGCVMGELLQRVPRVGAAATPALSVAPLFAVQHQRRLEQQQQQRSGAGGSGLLSASSSFTPPGSADDATANASANANNNNSSNNNNNTSSSTAAAVARAAVAEIDAITRVVGTPTRADVAGVESQPWRRHLSRLRCRAPTLQRRLGSAAGEVALSLLAHLLAFDPARRASAAEALAHEYFQGWSIERDLGGLIADSSLASMTTMKPQTTTTTTETYPPPPPAHYYEEPDPAAALALLEREADAACAGYVASHGCGETPGGGIAQTESSRRSETGIPKLRALLEAECASLAAAAAEARRKRREREEREEEEGAQGGGGVNGNNGGASAFSSSNLLLPPLPPPHRAPPPPPQQHQQQQRPSAHAAEAQAASRAFGAHVADAVKGSLEPSKFLSPGRHGEWSDAPGPPGGKDPGPSWGVSLPEGDEKMAQWVRKQQSR